MNNFTINLKIRLPFLAIPLLPVQVRYPTDKMSIFREVDAWRTFRSLRRTRTSHKIWPTVPLSILSRDLSMSDSRLKLIENLESRSSFLSLEINLPANNKIFAHLVLPWRAAFINGVKPDAFLASTSMSGHLWRSMFKHSVCPSNSNEILRET